MVKILGLPFDEYVDKQINIRQSKLAKTVRDPEDLVVFNANTAWLRVTSGVRIDLERAEKLSQKLGIPAADIEGPNLAKNLVLWGGASSFTQDQKTGNLTLGQPRGGVGYGLNNAYGFLTTSDQGYRPMPGITGMTCNYKNNGSLRQATVTIKCHSRSQFEAIEAVYLRLGYTVVMEWGNTIWFDNQAAKKETTAYSIPNLVFSDTPDRDTIQQKIYANRRDTAGNYDAMVGKVQNYSWTLNEDLSFDITLELVSIGDIIESLKANLTSTKAPSTSANIETEGNIKNLLNIIINKQTSQINTFFYELYTVFFTKLATSYGTEEVKKAVNEANKIEAAGSTLQAVREKYLKALQPFKDVITAVNKAFEIADRVTVDETGAIVIPPADTQQWLASAQALGTTTDALTSAVLTDDRKVKVDAKANSLGAFAKSINIIENYINNLTVSTKEGREITDELDKQVPEAVIYIALSDFRGGYFDTGRKYKIEGAQFSDGEFIDYVLTDLLQARFNKYRGIGG